MVQLPSGRKVLYLNQTVMYMLVIMVKLPSGSKVLYLTETVMYKLYMLVIMVQLLRRKVLYLMETVMYMLVIMVKLPSGRRARKRGSTPGTRSIRWKVLKSRKIIF